MPHRNDKGRFRTPTAAEKARDVDVRSATDVGKVEDMLKNGDVTFILVYADWCGHCHRYIPTWSELEKTPGRTANMARVHYDMTDKIPALKSAKLQGYPSVVKVHPDGRLESYTDGGEETNAMPTMRDTDVMKRELTTGGGMKGGGGGDYFPLADPIVRGPSQAGGAVLEVFLGALQQVGPAALLAVAHSALTRRRGMRGGRRNTLRRKTLRHKSRKTHRKN